MVVRSSLDPSAVNEYLLLYEAFTDTKKIPG